MPINRSTQSAVRGPHTKALSIPFVCTYHSTCHRTHVIGAVIPTHCMHLHRRFTYLRSHSQSRCTQVERSEVSRQPSRHTTQQLQSNTYSHSRNINTLYPPAQATLCAPGSSCHTTIIHLGQPSTGPTCMAHMHGDLCLKSPTPTPKTNR